MRIALATYERGPLPASDELLRVALERRGVRAEAAVWSDPALPWETYDAVVVRSCWDYHRRLPEFLAWVARVESRVINAAPLIRWNSDKRYLRGLDLPLPDSVWLEDEHATCDLDVLCRQRGWSAAVTKPFVSASAWRTSLGREGIARGPALVQEYVPQIHDGEWSLMYFGGVYSHAVRKRPAPGDFRVQGGSTEPGVPPRVVRELGARSLAALPHPPVLARLDLVETPRGPLVMELEVIEPELFLAESGAAAALAAAAILRQLGRCGAASRAIWMQSGMPIPR